jgi:hypothetical protein
MPTHKDGVDVLKPCTIRITYSELNEHTSPSHQPMLDTSDIFAIAKSLTT